MRELISFARLLRQAGLNVSPSEIKECLRGIELLKAQGQGSLHFQVLRSTLCKRVDDQHAFETLYGLFFSPNGLTAVNPANSAVRASHAGLKSLGIATLAQSMLSGEIEGCSNSIKLAVAGSCSKKEESIEEQVRKALVNLDYYGAINSLRLAMERSLLTAWQYENALKNAEKIARRVEVQVLHQLLQQQSEWGRVVNYLNWRDKSFGLLNPREMDLVRSYLDKIGKKLAVKPGLKLKTARNGKLDLARTLRKAMASGGIRWLMHSKKCPTHPNLVLLCDISNSVFRFTGFMLQLVAAIKSRFKQVRVFLFVDALWEAPDSMFRQDVDEVLLAIRENNKSSVSGLSDYGKVFIHFALEYKPENTKSSLIVLGDARNNWRPTEAETFKEICGRFEKVYWLNPFPASEWGQEDCQLKSYAPHCSAVFECGNVHDLEYVASKIF